MEVLWTCYGRAVGDLLTLASPQKAVEVSHRNVIANCIQYRTFEQVIHDELGIDTQVVLGLLPFSHSYALVVIIHACVARGDSVIVLPGFDLNTYLAATERFRIQLHYVVRKSNNEIDNGGGCVVALFTDADMT
jgi:acyl-CoA synthetase (AMP-forming)/AMP-acid ligase II